MPSLPSPKRKAQILAAQRKRRSQERLMRAAKGLCRDCPAQVKGRVLCRACSRKSARPLALAAFNIVKRTRARSLVTEFSGTHADRRWNGQTRFALTWALGLYRIHSHGGLTL